MVSVSSIGSRARSGVVPRSGDLRSGVAPGSEILAERVTFAERETLVERAALEHRCVR
jgi:hypothetical protein